MITITTDIDIVSRGVMPVIHLSQYDSDFTLVFNVFASEGTFTMPSGTTAEIRGTKTDGNGYDASGSVSGKVVTITGDEQMTAVSGRNIYEIALYYNSKRLNTINFVLDVERAALDADTITSASVLRELDDIIEGAETATEAAATATAAATEATSAVTASPLSTAVGDTYSSSADYNTGDYVMYNRQLYRAIQDITAEDFTAAHWAAVSAIEEAAAQRGSLVYPIGVDPDVRAVLSERVRYTMLYFNLSKGWFSISPTTPFEDRLFSVEILPGKTYTIWNTAGNTMHAVCQATPPENLQSYSNAITSQTSPFTIMAGPTDRYLVVQMFINNDPLMDYEDASDATYILEGTTMDYTYTTLADKVNANTAEIVPLAAYVGGRKDFWSYPYHGDIDKCYYTEDYTEFPYEATWRTHPELMKAAIQTMVTGSGGYLTYHELGEDNWDNMMYYIKTHPAANMALCARGDVSPLYPPQNPSGETAVPASKFKLVITSAIHGVEQSGDFAMYALIYKLLNDRDNPILEFIYNNVEICWMPSCSPSGIQASTYNSKDGNNVNQCFPNTADGEATCIEATRVMQFLAAVAEGADIHIDIHTFTTDDTGNSRASNHYFSWTFTNSTKMGHVFNAAGIPVMDAWRKLYPSIPAYEASNSGVPWEIVSAVNKPYTSTSFSELKYGLIAGTFEGRKRFPFEDTIQARNFNSAFLYDLLINSIAAFCRTWL